MFQMVYLPLIIAMRRSKFFDSPFYKVIAKREKEKRKRERENARERWKRTRNMDITVTIFQLNFSLGIFNFLSLLCGSVIGGYLMTTGVTFCRNSTLVYCLGSLYNHPIN